MDGAAQVAIDPNGSPNGRSEHFSRPSEGEGPKQDPLPQYRGNRREKSRLKAYVKAEIKLTHTDIPTLSCCFISGLIDSAVFNAFGIFVSMQTGNTIITGLGPSSRISPDPYTWAKSLTSIVCFFCGAFFFSRFCRFLGPLRRSTLCSSFLLQAVFIFITAAVIQAGVVDGTVSTVQEGIQWKQEIIIALLSFQSAGQIVESRNLGLNEIPTVVITSVLCDLGSDPKLTDSLGSNVKRNRRVLGFLCILIGAIISGFITRATGQMQTVLWIAGGIKFAIACSWAVWAEKHQVPI
ncbi:MAG: hypothetical protein M4579_001006 [Chaenotheca gracillima]|nr:MAG: hypothetical protein M4579_001006 [Chaenotheca gracillima]